MAKLNVTYFRINDNKVLYNVLTLEVQGNAIGFSGDKDWYDYKEVKNHIQDFIDSKKFSSTIELRISEEDARDDELMNSIDDFIERVRIVLNDKAKCHQSARICRDKFIDGSNKPYDLEF